MRFIGLRRLLPKRDAEGMDAEVLHGLTSKPRYLSFEYNAAPALVKNTQQCFEEARRLRYREANLTEWTSFRLVFDTWVEIKEASEQIDQWSGSSDRWGDVLLR
jgi:hypothetical protein